MLDGTWIFARKRNPEGQIIKYKGRFCVRGDQQVIGVDYFDTYSPITTWSTIRLMFIMSLLSDWAMVQVDYTNAFAQAFLKEIVYIKIPMGFYSKKGSSSEIVLRLIKSLYGLVQAPRTFYEHLTDMLAKNGFTNEPNIDPCLWMNQALGLICVIYVDDCLFFAKQEKSIHNFIDRIRSTMPLKVEKGVTAFLGIKIEKEDKTKNILLTQPGLIRQILKATDLESCNPTKKPASSAPLGTDAEGC